MDYVWRVALTSVNETIAVGAVNIIIEAANNGAASRSKKVGSLGGNIGL